MTGKLLLTSLLLFFFVFAVNAQTYPVVIRFTSECCGVPGNKPVIDFVKSFKKEYRIKKITAYKIGPLGREGEYDLAFTLKEMSSRRAKIFIDRLEKVCAKLKGQGKATVVENETIIKADLPQRATVEKLII